MESLRRNEQEEDATSSGIQDDQTESLMSDYLTHDTIPYKKKASNFVISSAE